MCAGPCRTLRIRVCSYTPRFSYDGSETRVPTTRYTAPTDVPAGAVYLGMVPGWVSGWVYRVGNQGVLPSHLPEEPTRRPATRGSGPCCRQGGSDAGWADAPGDGQDHPAGPVGRAQALPPCPSLANAVSGPKGRDLASFPVKLVRTARCHQNMSIRPPIVPVSKTGPKSHLLKFSDFRNHEPSLTRN